MSNAKNARSTGRQSMVNYYFSLFVERELYDKTDYHRFCKRVKNMSRLEIERIFRAESRMMGYRA